MISSDKNDRFKQTFSLSERLPADLLEVLLQVALLAVLDDQVDEVLVTEARVQLHPDTPHHSLALISKVILIKVILIEVIIVVVVVVVVFV